MKPPLFIAFGQLVLQGLFHPFTGLPGKMGAGVRITGGKIFGIQRTVHNQQLVFESSAVFAHHQMQIHQHTLTSRQLPIHGFGHLPGYFLATQHPV
jgi:hypothetical protein